MNSVQSRQYYYKDLPGPDKGYAWVVAIACFFINFILAGLARSVSVLYVALVEMYGVTRQEAALPFSIRASMRNMSGPLIGLLGQKYGIRRITALGGVVAGLGIILCYFAPNMVWITVFWGGIHGIGYGLSTVIHMMIISQYFDKYKASALGLGFSGDCFGTLVFPALIEFLLNTYDVKGTFLILGGVVLNVIPMALLLRKPPWLKENETGNFSRNIASLSKLSVLPDLKAMGIQNEAFMHSTSDLTRPERYQNKNTDSASGPSSDPPEHQVGIRNTVKKTRVSVPINLVPPSASHRMFRKTSEISNLTRGSLPPLPEKEVLASGNSPDAKRRESGADMYDKYEGEVFRKPHSASMMRRASSIVSQKAMDIVHRMRSASFASQVAQDGFMTTLQQEGMEEDDEETANENYAYQEEGDKKDDQNDNKFSPGEVNGVIQVGDSKHATRIILKKDTKPQGVLKLLLRANTKPIFILICLSIGVYAFCFFGVLTILLDYAVDNGISQDEGKYVIIAFSVSDLIGRLSFGQVIDRKLLKMKNYSTVSMLLMGTLVAVMPLNKSFLFMIVCMSVYGLVQGGTAIMFPILIGQYMEKNELTVAMGCLNFYGGLLMLLLAPMIGFFRDKTGSYDWVFHIQGCVVIIVGLMWQLEPLIIKYQNKRKKRLMNYVIVTHL